MKTLSTQQDLFLGPGRVERVDGNRLLLSMPNTQAWAFSAVGFPYRFERDDVVLAIGNRDEWYIIGVLSGKGKTSFHVAGDLQLHAPRGSIELIGARGIFLKSNNVSIVASRLNLVVRRLSQRFDDMRTWIKNNYELFASRCTTRVAGSYRISANKIVERAEGDVKIDGKRIHLG
jgi:hypothetical protein